VGSGNGCETAVRSGEATIKEVVPEIRTGR
jgi:hypothetical protein